MFLASCKLVKYITVLPEACVLYVWENIPTHQKNSTFFAESMVPIYLYNGRIFAGTIFPTRVGNMLPAYLKCRRKMK